MFLSIISGTKTQTRRLVKPQPQGCFVPTKDGYQDGHYRNFKPRYKVGEIVYIKEPFVIAGGRKENPDGLIAYKYRPNVLFKNAQQPDKWENPRTMPEKYARYFIQITGVRCERVQEISDKECLKEGIIKWKCLNLYYFDKNKTPDYKTQKQAFAALFNEINGIGKWESNPFVWCYSFKLVEK